MITITRVGKCKTWLADYLVSQGGEASAASVKAEAKLLGFTNGTLWRAASDLGVESERLPMRRPSSMWRLKS